MDPKGEDDAQELVSVIVPVYQVEGTLDRCVASILSQTFRGLEVLLIDDGSPDRCPALCDTWARRDPRVRVIHQSNAGLSAARNTGLDHARGSFIAFVDSDDEVLPTFIESMIVPLWKHHADMAVCGIWSDKPDWGDAAGNVFPDIGEVVTGNVFLAKSVETPARAPYVVAWNKLYRRRLFDSIRFPAGKVHEDEYVYHLVAAECRKIVCVRQALYRYYDNSQGIMRRLAGKPDFEMSHCYLNQAIFFANRGDIESAMVLFDDSFSWHCRQIRLANKKLRRTESALMKRAKYWLLRTCPGVAYRIWLIAHCR